MDSQVKMAADDPRLLIPKPRVDRLRKGPLVAALVALSVVITGGVLAAELVPSADQKKTQEGPKFSVATVPDDILKVPAAPPVRPSSQLSPAPPAARVQPPPPPTPAPHPDNNPYSAANLKRQRAELHWRALSADMNVELRPAAGSPNAPLEASEEQPSARRTSTITEPPVNAANAEEDANFQGRKNAFLARGHDGDGYLHEQLQHARSPYEIKAGTILPASLVTAINSDLPGAVIAQLRENVYDTVTGQYLLLPQGSKLMATYDSMVAWGQERVLLCWSRLLLPNGDSIQLDCMPGADLTGSAGLTDEVDEHWWRLIRGAAIASLLSGVTTAAAGSTTSFNPSVPQLWAHGAASEMASVGTQLTQRNMRIQPTIRIRQGWSMNVIVTRDMVLQPYDDSAGEDDDERAPAGG